MRFAPDKLLCNKERVLSIDAPATGRYKGFNAGIVVKGGVVTAAAPIIRYMIGWSEDRVRYYAQTKRWTVSPSL